MSLILALFKHAAAEQVDLQPMQQAIRLVDSYFKPHLRAVYQRLLTVPTTPLAKCCQAVFEALRTRPLTWRELKRQFNWKRFDGSLIDQAVNELLERGEITARQRPSTRAGTAEFMGVRHVDTSDDSSIQ